MDALKLVLSALAGLVPPAVIIFLRKRKKGSQKSEETIKAKTEFINAKIDALSASNIESLYPKSAFETLKSKKDLIKGEIDSTRLEISALEERIKNLTSKLEEKEKFHQQLKLPNSEVEMQAKQCLEKLTQGIELFSYFEKTIADFISKLETVQPDNPELEPYKANLSDFLLNLGNVTRSFLLMLKDLKEKIEGLKVQIDDLEVEFAKLLERQVSQ